MEVRNLPNIQSTGVQAILSRRTSSNLDFGRDGVSYVSYTFAIDILLAFKIPEDTLTKN